MKSAEIRKKFLEFFQNKNHKIVPSSGLIPNNDPTLLFTNAGMVPFKDCFLGDEQRGYTRATSSQRCVRAGGKHNDLENVGYTARHHTFFEMLGNFSFGDYFKEDAIKMAWEFITQVLKLPQDRLWVTVHHSDAEAEAIWVNQIGFDPARISKLDEDNFWQMGDTGPCGPCSEIFYDHGPEVAGGPPGSPEEDGDRYVEFWNLVFMQYERQENGEMKPLPKPSIDTGMGLERISAILQGVHNNYEIDLFQSLIKSIAEIIQFTGQLDKATPENQSLRVVADHIRAVSFLMVDGVTPSNEGRGYVLRRILRRALRHGYKVGAQPGFFKDCVLPLVREMGEAYPELEKNQAKLELLISKEEDQFQSTLHQGLKILDQDIEALVGDDKLIKGETLFLLYDTYGFPVDLTADVARERGLSVDLEGFEQCMQTQKERSRANSQFGLQSKQDLSLEGNTYFSGYEKHQDEASVYKLFAGDNSVDRLSEGQDGVLVAQQSPFYAESGGQVGDQGKISTEEGVFEVSDTQKHGDHHLHHGRVVQGEIGVNQVASFQVDHVRRDKIRKNHSATHLMHAALQQVLGDHVVQKGSHVDDERLRFDFSHTQAVSDDELVRIEQLVNQQIIANSQVMTEVLSFEDAMDKGAMALFGEKYDDEVRVLSMGQDNYSVELCGGCHVEALGDIGLFVIQSETGIASGVRRIEAITGLKAFESFQALRKDLSQTAQILKSEPARLLDRATQVMTELKAQDQKIQALSDKLALQRAVELALEKELVADVPVVLRLVEGVSPSQLKNLVDRLKNTLESGVILIAIIDKEKVQLCAGVTADLVKRVKAGDLVKVAAQVVGGKGGGRPELAMAGGQDASRVHEAIVVAKEWLETTLS